MCGIFGWSFGKGARAVLTDYQRHMLVGSLAALNERRGDKSWGVLGISRNVQSVEKGVGPITLARPLARMLEHATGYGHTRMPTTGDVTAENAHPFTRGRYTLAHNGVIYNHDDLNKDGRCQVDSENFLRALHGEIKWSDIQGYGALEWTDAESPGSIFLCRMRRGELEIRGIREQGGESVVGVVWTSDKDHLRETTTRLGINTFHFDVDEGEVVEARGGRLIQNEMRIELSAQSTTYYWPADDNEIEPSQKFCPQCGLGLRPSGWCPQCLENRTDWRGRVIRLPKSTTIDATTSAGGITTSFRKRLTDARALYALAQQLGLKWEHTQKCWISAAGLTFTDEDLISVMNDPEDDGLVKVKP